MHRRFAMFLLCVLSALAARAAETVVLLHGLAADAFSMSLIESRLADEGYRVVNLDYPSMSHPPEELARGIRAEIVRQVPAETTVHVVAHSMGGILLRLIQRDEPLANLGRAVMLAPPNHGSPLVNMVSPLPGLGKALGPAGRCLGEGNDAWLASLGPANFEVGVIAGDLGLDPLVSSLIAGPDDGIVPVASTRLDGMADFIVIHEAHPTLVVNAEAIDQTVRFLRTGAFDHATAAPEPRSPHPGPRR